MSDPIQIVTATDDNYVLGVIGTCYSIVKHLRDDRDIIFHVITVNVSNNNTKFLREKLNTVLSCDRFSLKFIEFNNIKHYDFNSSIKHITLASYARLFIPIKFKNLDYIIYLDSDVILRDCISEFWNKIDSEKVLTVVQEQSLGDVIPTKVLKKLNLNSAKPYFNSGVMGINLRLERECNLFKNALQLDKEVKEFFSPSDQDLLNLASLNNAKLINNEWNFPIRLNEDNIILAPVNAKLIHFTGPMKPWMFCRKGSHGLVRYYLNLLRKCKVISERSIKPYKQKPNIILVAIHYLKMKLSRLKKWCLNGLPKFE